MTRAPATYVYPQGAFLMYTRCAHLLERPSFHNPKHNVDMFFVRTVTAPSFPSCAAQDAELFVLPVLCTRSFYGLCGSHGENLNQLKTVLKSSPWFQQAPERHLLVCEDNGARAAVHDALPRVLLGLFEEHKLDREHTIAVGYTTYADIGLCPTATIAGTAMDARRFDFSAVMSVSMPPPKSSAAYARRQLLWCDWKRVQLQGQMDRARFHLSVADERNLSCSQVLASTAAAFTDGDHSRRLLSTGRSPDRVPVDAGRLSRCEAFQVLTESRFTINLAGDTPTTDRLFNAFDAGTAVRSA